MIDCLGIVSVSLNNVPNDPSSLIDNNVQTIYEDHVGKLWNRADLEEVWTSLIERVRGLFIIKMSRLLERASHNNVQDIYEDRGGNLWIGTSDGLNLLNRQTGWFYSGLLTTQMTYIP